MDRAPRTVRGPKCSASGNPQLPAQTYRVLPSSTLRPTLPSRVPEFPCLIVFCICVNFVPEPCQPFAHFFVVIKFTVHHHGDVARFVPNRLMPAFEINDAQ